MSARVLLVDDSSTILNFLAMGLSQKGYRVYTAENGVEALLQLAKQEVDLVVTDLNMPKMDGLTLVTRIRREKTLAGLPVVILSSEAEESDRKRGLQAGADEYFTKPIDIDRLDSELKALLEKQRS